MTSWGNMRYGPIGDAVEAAQDYTEGDPVGIYAAALAMYSAAINGYVLQPSGRPVAVWTVLVGRSKTGRKGFALNTAIAAVGRSINGFMASRARKGIKSGAALITTLYEVEQETLTSEDGIDGRVLIIEDEWASILKRANRDDDYYDNLIHAWDGAPMVNTTKGKDGRRVEQRVTSPLLGFHGHIQPARWTSLVKGDAVYSGAFNRVLPVVVDKSKNLPASMKDPHAYIKESPALAKAYEWARKESRIMSLSPQAAKRHDVYRNELDDRLADMPEARSVLVERADENLMRVACVLAAAARKTVISVKAWEAAREFVEYSMTSVDKLVAQVALAKESKSLPDAIRMVLERYDGEATSTLMLRALGTKVTAASLRAAVADMDDVEVFKDTNATGRGAKPTIYRFKPKAAAAPEPARQPKPDPEPASAPTPPSAVPSVVRSATKQPPRTARPKMPKTTEPSAPQRQHTRTAAARPAKAASAPQTAPAAPVNLFLAAL